MRVRVVKVVDGRFIFTLERPFLASLSCALVNSVLFLSKVSRGAFGGLLGIIVKLWHSKPPSIFVD